MYGKRRLQNARPSSAGRDRAAARCSRQENRPQQELLCVRGHLAPDRGHGGLLPGASASCARRGARDARNPGAVAQETHQTVTAAPVWKIDGTASDPFKVEAGDYTLFRTPAPLLFIGTGIGLAR